MPWNLLILPLLGGFCFLNICYRFRFRAQRLSGYRLLFEAAIAGVVLSGLARVLTYGLAKIAWVQPIVEACRELFPFPFAGTAVTAFLLGVTLAFPVNRWILGKSRSKRAAVEQLKDPMLQLVYNAIEKRQPVFVTLDNRKVYVGYVIDSPDLEQDNVHMGLVPLLSGYRDAQTLRTHFSVDYLSVFESPGVDHNDFMVVIPLDRVSSAHLFDLEMYTTFFADPTPTSG